MKSILAVLLCAILAPQLVLGQENGEKKGSINATIESQSILQLRTPQNLNCDIGIETHTQNTFYAEFRVWAKARTIDQENRFISLIEVRLDKKTGDKDKLSLQVLAPTRAPWEGTDYQIGVELNIVIPEYFRIDSRNSYSELDFTGPFGGIDIDCEYGSIRLEKVKGELIIKSSYTTIELSELEGGVSIDAIYSEINAELITIEKGPGIFETSYGEINLDNIVGSVEATTNYEDIYVSNIEAPKGSVVLRTDYGRIEADNITGELVCETNFEPIDLTNIVLSHGNSKFETKHAPIDVEISQLGDSQLIINNTYSSINLIVAADISAKLLLAVDEGGKIHTQGLAIKPLVMERNRLVGITGEGLAKIEMNIDGIGEINIQGR